MSLESEQAPLALIADDDEFMRLMLTEAARAGGFEAHAVTDGAEVLAFTMKRRPDIFLLDVNMPGMNGFETCRALRATGVYKATPIVVVTGNDESEAVNEAYDCGATDFVPKPINMSLLAHRLRYIMRGAKTLQELHVREEKIHKLAYFDALTGRPNREMLQDTISRYLSSLVDSRYSVSLIHADLDSFQRFNESFGYAAGDELLVSIVDRLDDEMKSVLPNLCQSMLGRVGGDELVIAICGPEAGETASALARQLTDCLASPFAHERTDLYVSMSMGIASTSDPDCDFETLMKNATTALNASKAIGRGKVRQFHDSMACESLERLREDKLDLYYQPKYGIKVGEIVGVEALMRWHDETLGWIPPDQFIPLAEQTGLIMEINAWVVDRVCKQLKDWGEYGIEVPVAINLSAAEFVHGDPVSLITEACEDADIDPSLFEIEITESTLMVEVEKVCAVLRRLRDIGVRVSIDDFGTGYSSLAYLKRFDLDTLKIDRSFVEDIASDDHDRDICRAIIALAQSLSLTVVAEGVETAEQNAWLAQEDCDYVQGYLWSKPVPPDELQLLLVESKQGAATGFPRAAVV
jgi:diguanylate cyclase (GGDEF)-like protein